MAEDSHSLLAKLERSKALRYALAPVCIALAVLLHLSVIGSFFHPTGVFLACIVAAAWFGGAGPGFLAALLATLVLPRLIATQYPLIAGFFDLPPRFLTFGITGVAVGLGSTFRRRAGAALRRSELELRKARSELETKVLEQTAELRRSETLLAEAQKLSQTGSFGWKVSTGEILWSEETFRIFGYDRTTKPTVELILNRVHPDDRSRVRETVDRAAREGANIDFEHRLLMPDGSIKHVHMVVQNVALESGPPEFVGAVTDITDRKRTEDALRRSEAFLLEVQTLSHTGGWRYDVVTDIVESSPEILRAYAAQPGDQISRPPFWFDRIHPDDRARVQAEFERCMREKTEYRSSYRIVLPDRGIKYVHATAKPVVNDAGELVEFIGASMDMTEHWLAASYRSLAEEALRKSEERWRAVFENSAIGVALTDQSGRFLAANSVFQNMMGYTEEEICKLTILDITHEDYREFNWELITELLEGKRKQFQIEKQHWRKDGSLIWVSNNVSLVPGTKSMPRFIMALSENITERKRTEEALRKTQAELAHVTRVATLGEMTASIAHEINQPLGAIVNSASACLRWLDAQKLAEARQSASRVIAEGHRASEIIGRIRALVKKAPPRKDWLDVNEAIHEVIALAHSEVQRNGVALETQLSDDVPVILADRIQLQQVILNLMMNAIEAMSGAGEGPRELLVRSGTDELQGVLVSVRDSGPGLDPKNLDQLFDAFYTTKPQGLGMGLAISRSLIEAHGGRLWATANAPHGAVFQFTLPIGSERVG